MAITKKPISKEREEIMKARRIFLGLVVLTIFGVCSGSSFGLSDGDLIWARQAGGEGDNYATCIASLDDGSWVITGVFEGTAVFGAGEANETELVSAGGRDIFIAKYGGAGTLDWARQAGGASWDFGDSIASYGDGSSVVTGFFSQTAVFGPGEANETSLTSAGFWDVFIARYNTDGTLAWVRRAGGTDYARGSGIASYGDGSCVITGYFEGTAVFGEGEANETELVSAGSDDIFIAKYSEDGTLDWARQAGGATWAMAYSIATYVDGSSVVTGFFSQTVVFGPGEANETELVSAGSNDIFIAKYSEDGTLAWARRAGGEEGASGSGIASYASGSCVVTGGFAGTAIFGKGEANETSLTATGDGDMFVAKFSPDGTLAWAKRAGSSSSGWYAPWDRGNAIASYTDGSSVVTGHFCGTAVFGEGEANETSLTATGDGDMFVAGFNPDGTLAWVRRAGSSARGHGCLYANESGRGIATHIDGSSAVVGWFYQTAIFGEGEDNETTLVTFDDEWGPFSDIFITRYQGTLPVPPAAAPWITDYSGDGTSDIAIFRPSSGLWAIRGLTRIYFGSSNDLPVPGDYTGDGTTEIAVFRESSGLWAISGGPRIYFGGSGDLPVPGDYNASGTADVAIYRAGSGLWAIRNVTRIYFGGTDDIPVPGYYDGIQASPGIFRPSSGLWAIRGVTRTYFGGNQDDPVPGDYDGDGRWTPAIFRPTSGLWAVQGGERIYFGGSTDAPIPGGYKGDGTDYPGIFRGSSGLWAIRGVTRTYFGSGQDVPVTR